MKIAKRLISKIFGAELTYSQAGEDRILQHLFYTSGKDRISYLEIGTNHPFHNNNTYSFYQNGSRGVCVEPNPALYKLIRKRRPRDVSLNIGISPSEDGVSNFYVMSSHTLSTFSKEEAEALHTTNKYRIEQVIPIKTRSINSLVAEYFTGKELDLVSIDVEGWNEQIISSFDFSVKRPFCFCIETIEFAENKIMPSKLEGIFTTMKNNSYVEYASTCLNTIFVDQTNI